MIQSGKPVCAILLFVTIVVFYRRYMGAAELYRVCCWCCGVKVEGRGRMMRDCPGLLTLTRIWPSPASRDAYRGSIYYPNPYHLHALSRQYLVLTLFAPSPSFHKRHRTLRCIDHMLLCLRSRPLQSQFGSYLRGIIDSKPLGSDTLSRMTATRPSHAAHMSMETRIEAIENVSVHEHDNFPDAS